MATLLCPKTNKRITLGAYVTVGRSSKSLVRVYHQRASAMHAIVSWEGDSWFVRDLNSTNGVVVDGHIVQSNDKVALSAGATIWFGDEEECWVLEGAGPPMCSAMCDDGRRVEGTDNLLNLPGEGEIECQVVRHDDGSWYADIAARSAPAADQGQIELPSGVWRLELPQSDERTDTTEHANMSAVAESWSLDSVEIWFHRSADGDDVEVTLVGNGRKETINKRFGEMWYLLAAERVREYDTPDEREHGWKDKVQLFKDAGLDSVAMLNDHVYRLRACLSKMGLSGGYGMIERRPNTLRLGTSRVRFD